MASKTITLTFDTPQEKKKVVRYDNADENSATKSFYVDKADLKKLGNPSEIKVTIEAA